MKNNRLSNEVAQFKVESVELISALAKNASKVVRDDDKLLTKNDLPLLEEMIQAIKEGDKKNLELCSSVFYDEKFAYTRDLILTIASQVPLPQYEDLIQRINTYEKTFANVMGVLDEKFKSDEKWEEKVDESLLNKFNSKIELFSASANTVNQAKLKNIQAAFSTLFVSFSDGPSGYVIAKAMRDALKIENPRTFIKMVTDYIHEVFSYLSRTPLENPLPLTKFVYELLLARIDATTLPEGDKKNMYAQTRKMINDRVVALNRTPSLRDKDVERYKLELPSIMKHLAVLENPSTPIKSIFAVTAVQPIQSNTPEPQIPAFPDPEPQARGRPRSKSTPK